MKYLGMLFFVLFVFTLGVLYAIIGEGDFVNIIDTADGTFNYNTVDAFTSSALANMQPLPHISLSTPSDLDALDASGESEIERDIFGALGEVIYIYDTETKEIFHEKLDDYLCGVVFAEMPSSFEVEALKAQAVAARSYSVYKALYSSESERAQHFGADICTDSAHCKAYISYENACLKWGEEYISPFWDKVKAAVSFTSGQIIVYDSEPAIAVFHAISNNLTESAENIWGGDVPYLVSVPTAENENAEAIKDFSTLNIYKPEEFKSKLVSNGFREDFGGNPESWVGEITLNSSGRVDNIKICGKIISGKRLREIFSLRSTDFYLEYKEIDGEFIFNVKGYGHGVGMSQHGANLMAQEGKNYEDILLWYYMGVDIINIYDN